MKIVKAEQACYEEATTLIVNDNDILLGLYDDVEERYFALISVVEQLDKKKKIYYSNNGLFLDSNSPALLKVFELEMVKYLKTHNIKYLKTTINSDIDIKACGLKYNNQNEVIIYASSMSKIFR